MKNNQVSIFVFLILSAVIGGVLFFVNRSSQEYLGWSPDEMYGDLSRAAYDGSAFTNATFSGSSNGGGVALSMQGGSLSSRTRVSSSRPITSHQYPIANSPLPISNLQSPIANGQSPIAYMTSGAEFRSFGGGGNGSAGSAGTFRTNSQSPITNSQLPISNIQLPIANNPSPISNSQLPIANHPSPIANSQLPIANNPSNMFGYELKITFGTASYDMMSYYATNGNRINNRFNAPPGMSGEEGDDDGNAYESWLQWMYKYGNLYGKEDDDEDNAWVFGDDESMKAFLAWYLATYNEPYDESGAVTPKVTYEQWVSWFKTNGSSHYYNGNAYYYIPVGNILPLLMLALVYVVCVRMRRRKAIQQSSTEMNK